MICFFRLRIVQLLKRKSNTICAIYVLSLATLQSISEKNQVAKNLLGDSLTMCTSSHHHGQLWRHSIKTYENEENTQDSINNTLKEHQSFLSKTTPSRDSDFVS